MAFCKEDFEKVSKILLKKTCDDEEFRSLCLSDTEEALKDLEDEDIPEDLNIKIVRNLDDHNNLPDENELWVELGEEKFCCRYKFRNKGICSTYMVSELVSDDYNLDGCADSEE